MARDVLVSLLLGAVEIQPLPERVRVTALVGDLHLLAQQLVELGVGDAAVGAGIGHLVGVVQHAAHGDYLGALSQASGVLSDVGARDAAQVLSEGARLASVAQQVAAGHYGTALNQASVFLPGEDAFRRLKKGDLKGVSTALNRAADEGPAALRPALNKAARAATQAQAKADAFESQMKNALRNIG